MAKSDKEPLLAGVEGLSIGFPKKTSMLVFAATLVLAVALRTNQLLTNMNYSTGRYIDNSPLKNFPVIVICIGMILIAALLLLGVAKDKAVDDCILINPWRLRYDRLNKKMPGAAAVSSLIMSLALIIEMIMSIGVPIAQNKEIKSKMLIDEAEDYSLLTGITAVDWINIVIMILVLLIFITMAMNIIKKEGISRANCAAMSCYAAWKVFEIYVTFSRNSVIAASSDKVYDLLVDMSSVIFFLCLARLFMGMEKKFTRFWFCMSGYFTSILAAVTVLPRYITLLIPTGYDDRLGMAMPNISDIGLIFVPVSIVAVLWGAYSYREMPKGISDEKRWTLNARPKNPDMDDIDVSGSDTDSI